MNKPYVKPQIILQNYMMEDVLLLSSMQDPAGDDIFGDEWEM